MRPPKRLSSRAFWGLASWALPLGVVFVVSPKLLHLLGAERFGVLMIALVTPIIACQLEFGITSAALRRFAARLTEGRIDAGRTLFTLFVALTIIGLALGIAIWASADLLSAGLGFTATLGAMQGPQLRQGMRSLDRVEFGHACPRHRRTGRSGARAPFILADHCHGRIVGWRPHVVAAKRLIGQCRRSGNSAYDCYFWRDDAGPAKARRLARPGSLCTPSTPAGRTIFRRRFRSAGGRCAGQSGRSNAGLRIRLACDGWALCTLRQRRQQNRRRRRCHHVVRFSPCGRPEIGRPS